jgi:hypothetical protein
MLDPTSTYELNLTSIYQILKSLLHSYICLLPPHVKETNFCPIESIRGVFFKLWDKRLKYIQDKFVKVSIHCVNPSSIQVSVRECMYHYIVVHITLNNGLVVM